MPRKAGRKKKPRIVEAPPGLEMSEADALQAESFFASLKSDDVFLPSDGVAFANPLDYFGKEIDSLTILERILMSVISGHPNDVLGRGNRKRLAVALSALTGRVEPRGSKLYDDSDVLDSVCLEIYKRSTGRKEGDPSFASCLSAHSSEYRDATAENVKCSIYRRLFGKYQKDRDRIFVRILFGHMEEFSERKAICEDIIVSLRLLGIAAGPFEASQNEK